MADVGVDVLNVIAAIGAFAAAANERDVQHSGSIGKLAVGSAAIADEQCIMRHAAGGTASEVAPIVIIANCSLRIGVTGMLLAGTSPPLASDAL